MASVRITVKGMRLQLCKGRRAGVQTWPLLVQLVARTAATTARGIRLKSAAVMARTVTFSSVLLQAQPEQAAPRQAAPAL